MVHDQPENHPCPSCHGDLYGDPMKDTLKCADCGDLFTEGDIREYGMKAEPIGSDDSVRRRGS